MPKPASLICILLLGWLLNTPLISAQTNLEYYLREAETRSPFLKDFVYQQEIAGLEIQKVRTQFEKPQWTVTGDYLFAPYFFNNGRVIAITSTPDARAFGYDAGVSNGGLYSGQVNVNYQLFTERQSQPLIQQQELAQLGWRNQHRLLQVDLKRRITADYLNAYLIQLQMDYILQVKDRLNKQREFVRKLADRGVMRITDLELLSLEIKNQDFLFNTLDIQYRQAIMQLNADAGIADTAMVRLDSMSLDIAQINDQSVFLQQFRIDSLSAENDQAVFETRYVPQVNVFANGGLNAVELNNIYRKVGVSAGIHISWLFRDGGQKNINAQQNEIRKMTAQNQRQFMQNQIANNRMNNALILQQSLQNIEVLDAQLTGYEKTMTSYRQEFALGQLSVIDYLNVVRTYADLQQQKAQLEVQLLIIINEINYWNN